MLFRSGLHTYDARRRLVSSQQRPEAGVAVWKREAGQQEHRVQRIRMQTLAWGLTDGGARQISGQIMTDLMTMMTMMMTTSVL
jgi:hypothetical protein